MVDHVELARQQSMQQQGGKQGDFSLLQAVLGKGSNSSILDQLSSKGFLDNNISGIIKGGQDGVVARVWKDLANIPKNDSGISL